MPFDASGTFTRLRGANSWVGDATANTPIRADLHDNNDNDFANGLSDCITKSGRTQPTADLPMAGHKLVNLGEPTASSDSATKAYVDAAIAAATAAMSMPTGVMMSYGKVGAPPAGWLYCNGAAVSRATYANLFAVIGTTFGPGDGSATFNLPDFRGRFARGWNDDAALDPARVFGSTQTDDIESHTHTASSGGDTPDHTHGFAASGNTGTVSAFHQHQIATRLANIAAGSVPVATDFSSAQGYMLSESENINHSHGFSVSGNTGGRSAVHTHAITVNPVGGAETRPHNVAVVWIIKT